LGRARRGRRGGRRLSGLLTPGRRSRLGLCLSFARGRLSCSLGLSLTLRILAPGGGLSFSLLLALRGGGGLLLALASGLLLDLTLVLLTPRLGFRLTGLALPGLPLLLLRRLPVALGLLPPRLSLALTLGLGFTVGGSLLLPLALGGLLLLRAGAFSLSLTLRLLAGLLLLSPRLLIASAIPITAIPITTGAIPAVTVAAITRRDGYRGRRVAVAPVLPAITTVITARRASAIATIRARSVTTVSRAIIAPVIGPVFPTVVAAFLATLTAAFGLLPLAACFQFTTTPRVLLDPAALGLGGRLTQGSRPGQIAAGIAAALARERAVKATAAGIIDDDQLAALEGIAVVRVTDVVGLVLTGPVVVPALLAALETFQIALAALVFPVHGLGRAIVIAVVRRRIAVAAVCLDRLGPGVTGRRGGLFRGQRRRRRFWQGLGGGRDVVSNSNLDAGLVRRRRRLVGSVLVASREADNQKRPGHHQNSFHHLLAPFDCLTRLRIISIVPPLRRGA